MASLAQLAPDRQRQDSGIGMESNAISITYQTSARDRPLAAIRVHRAAGDPRRGWLTADGWTVPVALGRGGILANKREGDGGTPKGTYHPLQLWWRAALSVEGSAANAATRARARCASARSSGSRES